VARPKHKRGDQPLTLLIVPHSEQAPIAVHIPTRLFPILILMAVVIVSTLVVLTVSFYVRSQQLEAQLRNRAPVSPDRSRSQEMRRTILSQYDEVKSLQAQFEALSQATNNFQANMVARINQFEAGMAELDRVSAEIRNLVGLPAAPTPTPESKHMPSPQGKLIPSAMVGYGSSNSLPGGQALPPLELDRYQNSERLDALLQALPVKLAELQQLKEAVAVRVALVETEKRRTAEELERQLKLIAASPKGWPLYGDITSGFGWRRFRGVGDFHTGLDIGAWYRTPVAVTQDGVVTYTGWETGYGWTIEVKHTMGFSTLYGHLSRYLVSPGDEVKKGDIIGLSGNSGNSTGPHLHYEIRLNGVSVDPMKYVKMTEN